MKSGGCLILLEKVLSNDKYFNRTFIDIYHEYKISKQGYSNVEIQKKREALENVLIPYKVDENVDLLKKMQDSKKLKYSTVGLIGQVS